MYTQTIYELSQEAERLLMLSLEHLKTVKKCQRPLWRTLPH